MLWLPGKAEISNHIYNINLDPTESRVKQLTTAVSKQKTETHIEVFGGTISNGSVFEAIYNPELTPPLQFAIAAPHERHTVQEVIEDGNKIKYPPQELINPIEKGSISLASDVSDYGNAHNLLQRIERYVNQYVDLPSYDVSLIAHYAMTTWVWNAFNAFPYLRFKGEPGTGKTRCLEVMKQLCYRATDLGGASSKSAILRFIDKVRGTALIDESDYDADLKSDLIKLLNMGYRKDGTISLSSVRGDDWTPEIFNVGCPKVMANRLEFLDRALETRCLTIYTLTKKLAEHVPVELPDEFFGEGRELRNQLLRWRMDVLRSVGKSEENLKQLEGRVRQLALPLYSISPDTRFKRTFLRRLALRSNDLREQDPSHIVLEAILSLPEDQQKKAVPVQTIAERASDFARKREVLEDQFKPKLTARLLRSHGFKTRRRGPGFIVFLSPKILKEQCDHFGIRFSDERGERDVHVAEAVTQD